MKLRGIRIAFLGGDERELVLISELTKMGAQVVAIGFPARPELSQVQLVDSIKKAIVGAQVIILPVPGTDINGRIKTLDGTVGLVLTEKLISQIPRQVPIIVGMARPFLREWVERYGIDLIEILDMDQVAILNSIPSAEGAIQIAMEKLPITIHNSNSWVLGFGRVGKTLARMLDGLGAKTTVCARNPVDLARILEIGYTGVTFEKMPELIGEAEIIFNTVPAMVLDEKVLQHCNKEVLIVDLASAPGGTDFQAAEKLGIEALLAPGLPGKVAPRTAGKILAQVIPDLILKHISGSISELS